ncbi:MAG: ABC transporter substrate-binding protein [Euryarchaeota archaeon]|nr:ABC transporter substrate-binding protein [Euryarchaeota archaeon]
MRKNLKFLSLLLFCILLFSLSGCAEKINTTNTDNLEKNKEIEETITLVDSVGRKVTMKHPVEKAVVVDRYNNEMIRACGAIDKVVAVDMNTAQDRNYWSIFDTDNVVGKGCTEYDYEKVIEQAPDIFIISDISPYEETEAKLEPFDIPVYALIAYVPSQFEENVKNTGKIFGVEEGAQEFFEYFDSKLRYIKENLEGVEKKSVYFETTTAYKTTFPGSGYHEIIEYAGGENIFASDYKSFSSADIDPEMVIDRNPDVIVKLITADQAISGSGIYQPPTKEDFQKAYQEIISRPGWDSINAVKNNEIYFMSQFGQGGACKLVGTIYLSEWMYPEILTELNPEEVFKDWMEKFQKFEYIDGHFFSGEELK